MSRTHLHRFLLATLLTLVLGGGCATVGTTFGQALASNSVGMWLSCVVVLNSVFLFLYTRFRKNRQDNSLSSWTDPVVLFVVSFTLYEVAFPFDFARHILSNYPVRDVLDTLNLYMLANAGLLLGSVFVLIHRRNQGVPRGYTRIVSSAWNVGLSALCVGLCLLVIDQARMGGLSVIGITNRLANFQAQLRLTGNAVSLPWKEIISSAFLVMALSTKNRRQLNALLIMMIAVSIFYLFGLGSRTYVFICGLPSLAALVDRGLIKLNKKRSFILMISIVVMISPWFSNYRDYIIGGVNPSLLAPAAWAYSKGELGGQFQVAIKVLENHGWWFGADPSYLTAALYSLPKSIYSFMTGHPKPPDLAAWYSSTYYGRMWVESGVGWGFSPVIQAWMNGGIAIVMLVYALMSALTTMVKRGHWFSYVLLPQLIWFQRVDFHSFFYQVLYCSVFVVLLLSVSHIIDLKRLPFRSPDAASGTEIT